MEKVHIAEPQIGDEEISAVVDVMRSGMLAQGPRVQEFEDNFARYVGAEYAVMVNSGTAAIHCALDALGVGPGDEVITTPFTFIGTVNPIIMQGAKVMFADIDKQTFNINPASVEAAITKNTKAIIGVDLFGQPHEYYELQLIAQKHGLALVEDACQAVGASYMDIKTGLLGDVGCFSLYPTKNMTSGEGGIITTDSYDIATRTRQFRQHGMSGPYVYEGLGYNYRATDIAAAIATQQLLRVDGFNLARQQNAATLNQELEGVGGITIPRVADNRTHVYHQYTIRVGNDFPVSRDELAGRLSEMGIGSGIYYPRTLNQVAHIQHSSINGNLPEAEAASDEVLSLPVHPKVTSEQLERIGRAIRTIASA